MDPNTQPPENPPAPDQQPSAMAPETSPEMPAPQPQPTVTGPSLTPETYTVGGVVQPQQPAGKPKRRFALKKPVLLGGLIALVLLGGSAAAYFGYYVPNKPQNVLAKGLQNTLAQHQAITEGTADISSSGVSGHLDYTAKINADSHSADINLDTTISGVKLPVELLSTKGNLYFKLGDLSTLEGVIKQLAGSSSSTFLSLEQKINKDVANQWIEVDSTLIKEAKLDCLTAYPAPLDQADIQALTNSYKQKPFATVASTTSDTVNGSPAYKYVLNLNDNTAAAFNLNGSAYFKKLSACMNQGAKDTSSSLNLSSLKDNDKTPITLWVDKKTKLVVKYASQSTAKDKSNGTSGSLSGTIKYQSVDISAPASAKPVLNLLNDLDLGSLFSGTDSLTAGSGTQDTERQTDINAIRGQLEAYWAENGYYPTLANLNDAAWRATNMKGFDAAALKDPTGTSSVIAAAPASHVYSYQVTPAGCDNAKVKCTAYTLTTTLDSGGTYSKQSLN